jgi:hypothetical protein
MARFRIEPPAAGDVFLCCRSCKQGYTSSDVEAEGNLGSIHSIDIRLISAFIRELATREEYTPSEIDHHRETLIMLAQKIEQPLHEASINDLDDPANRRGRVPSKFFRYLHGHSRYPLKDR